MTKFKLLVAALGASGALLGFATTADAQYYGEPQRGYYQQRGGYYQQPQYVPPRVARKQRQLEQRFIEKFGYVQPQRGYVQPQRGYGQPQRGYGNAYGRQRYAPREQGFDQYGRPLYYNPKR